MNRLNNIPLYLDDDQINNYSSYFKKGWKKLIKVLLFLERHPDVEGLNWLNQNRIEKSIECFNKCVEAFPRSWSSMWGLGKAYQIIGNHCASLEWFEKAYLLKQDLVDVALEASIEAMRIGNATKALKYAESALALDRRNPDFHANHALALLLNKQAEEAFVGAEKALQLAPNSKRIQNINAYIRKMVFKTANYPMAIDPDSIYRGRQ